MECGHSSSSYMASTPLFPAYSSSAQNEEEKMEWLSNSSFTESAFKQVCFQPLNVQNADPIREISSTISAKSTPVQAAFQAKQKKKSRKKKTFEKYQDPSSFAVPESESVLCQLRKKVFIEETGLSFERAFQTDVRRDPDNLMFECFERTKIANYHVNVKVPVGLSPKELSSWPQTLQKKKEKCPPRYFSKSFSKSMKNATTEVVHVTKEPVQNTCLNYLPISVLSNNVESVQTESVPNFINVSSSWKSENYSKEKIIDSKISTEFLDSEMREKVIYFNKKLSENPDNIEMWIDFVDFQDKLLLSQKVDKSHIYSESNITEKKISILEKALKYNPKDVRLSVMKLKLSQNLYSSDEVISMWNELIFFNPNNSEVWQEYILYVTSNITTSNVPSILKLYSKCLRTLSNVCEGITESHEPTPDMVTHMLGIFNQLCCFLRSCGYAEKAIAAYQALIELNLFSESHVESLSMDKQIACLEPFWDSGAKRIGENNAIGWAATVKKKTISFDHISTDSDLNDMEDETLKKKLRISETWLEFERLRGNHHWLPWRPNPEYDQTDDDIDDLERIVSFDDVSKFLFCVRDEEHKFLLVIHFVTFLGFDVHLLGCHNIGNGISNPFDVENYGSISKQLNKSQLIHPLTNPVCFDIHFWTTERYNFINNIFSQVADKFTPKYKLLCTYMWVKFKRYYILEVNNRKNKEDIINLKKFVKSILKKNENRNCLLLWFEYISIEWLIDKSNAVKTFQALFLSSTSAASEGNMQLQEMWYFVQAFIELSMDNLEKPSSEPVHSNEILWILIHIINKEKYVPHFNQEIKPTVILKTLNGFKSVLEKELISLSSEQSKLCFCINPYIHSVINYAKCFAYFQYFSQGCDAAMQVYENIISDVESKVTGHWGRYISEQINVAESKLLNYHTWNSTTSIKPLQTFLCHSVTKYPYNSQLLYLLVKLRSASSVISPTRRFLSQILKDHHKSNPVTVLFALITEFSVCSSLLLQNDVEKESQKEILSTLGINWRIRSLYENMLQSDKCALIPILWRSYLKFEIMTQNTEKAKGIFHRALQVCGWSKELLMDAAEYFPDELEDILAFMTAKQIRIYSPLEEVTLLKEHAIAYA